MLEVSDERRQELIQELQAWNHKRFVTRKQLQSLIGKLNFKTNCVRPRRIFLSRLIELSTCCPEPGTIKVPDETRKDVNWWKEFLPTFNGLSILWLHDSLEVDHELATDGCLSGGGAVCGSECFHLKFNPELLEECEHINQLELYTITIAVKQWKEKLNGNIVRLSTDNEASVWAVNKGRTKDKFMLKYL